LGIVSRTLNRLLVAFGVYLFIRANSLSGATVVACRFDGRARENVVVNIPAVIGFAAFLIATRHVATHTIIASRYVVV
jgi:bifunctional N-acetylglucosamine-1-phosphate-uridyltransferase/glucosamine-1-phosphate-acetyltransferase GlmU-like protein